MASNVLLACALPYFAGSAVYDIAPMYRLSYSDVLSSIWIIINDVNTCPNFHISYPESVKEQMKIAAGFQRVSTPGINACISAINGILAWIVKLSLKEATAAGIGQRKFLCGRKHKFGLNFQAVSNCCGHNIDISVKYGGLSSDLLAFEASDLFHHLENHLMKKDHNKPRFVLFDDNVYLNISYNTTQFPNVSSNQEQRSYNLYHLQLCIRVGCAFGVLVQR